MCIYVCLSLCVGACTTYVYLHIYRWVRIYLTGKVNLLTTGKCPVDDQLQLANYTSSVGRPLLSLTIVLLMHQT